MKKTKIESVKEFITLHYPKGGNQTDLAHLCNVSRRTIGRAFDELGIITPIKQMHSDMDKVMSVLRRYNIAPANLHLLIKDYIQLIAERKLQKEYAEKVKAGLTKQTSKTN